MKRILLTSTALVAFAGAAAADVSFSGTAEFSYNDTRAAAYANDIEIVAAGSAALNNGYTASASLTLNNTGITDGDITIANDASSITYDVGMNATGAALIGDSMSQMSTVFNVFGDSEADEATPPTAEEVEEITVITGETSVAGANIAVSIDQDGNYQLGVSTDLGGTALAVGFDGAAGGAFGVQMSGSASAFEYTAAFGSNDAYGISATTTAGGADITLNAGDLGWDIGASMPLGAATVGIELDDAQAWTVSLATTMDAVSVDVSFQDNSDWDVALGYAAGAMTVDFATDEDSLWSIDATYDLGNGITAGAGTNSASAQYVEVDYDLGGGANVSLDYATAADINPAEEILEGTTTAVSFLF
jgi:hypothetical protein